jgi:hypothetical protein
MSIVTDWETEKVMNKITEQLNIVVTDWETEKVMNKITEN